MQNDISGLPNMTIRGQETNDAQHLRTARNRLLLATVVTMALWFVPYSNYLLYPLRLFITFIHESGHALATVATGGMVESLHVHADGSGVTYTRESPLWAWLILSGGYLGTTVFGALMLVIGRVGKSANAGRVTLYAMAGFLALVTLLWIGNPITNGFTFVTGLLLAAGLFALARFTSPQAAAFIASFLAVQSSLNALGDLRILLYLTSNRLGDNDAVFMAQSYGLSPVFWASLWAITAIVILACALRVYWKRPAPQAAGRF